MKTILKLLGFLLVVVLLIVAGRTLLIPSKQIARIPYTPETFDAQAAARKLSETITFPTISWEGGGTEDQKRATQQAFAGFHAHLEKSFPQVYAKLDHETIGENNLLFTWKGSDPSLKPMLVMGHQDVVPIEAGTEGNWTHPPFSGDIADGFIWGRGTLDDKMTVVGLLEAADILLAKGFQPKRTIYFAFGQDEEIGGLHGAQLIAQTLQSRGVQLEFVEDEGGFLSLGLVPGVSAPVAMIGTSEKGYLSLELSVETAGGHSSVSAERIEHRHPCRGGAQDRAASHAGPCAWPGWRIPGICRWQRFVSHARGLQEHVALRPRGAENSGIFARFECHAAHYLCDYDFSCRNERQRDAQPGHGGGELPPAARGHHRQRDRARARRW